MKEMKDSGIDWIGKIPKDWNKKKIKYIAKIINGYSFKSELYKEEGINVIRITNVEDGKVNKINPRFYDFSYQDEIGEAMLKLNDILMTLTGNVGYVGLVSEDILPAGLNQRVGCIRKFDKELDNKFLFYCFNTKQFCDEAVLNSKGTAQLNMSTDWLASQFVVYPNLEKQKRIVEILDEKIKEIENVIEKTKQTIDDYKLYKQSIITKAVTKGLDENVEMKETGSEWIGKIPAHWNYLRINRLFDYIDERNTDENAELLSLYTAIGVKPRSELEEKGNKAITVMNYKIVKENDIIVNKLLAWMGAISYSNYNGVTSPDYDVYRAKENSNVAKEYYNAYFRYTCFKGDCYKYGHGIMMMRWRTYPEEFLRIEVPNPPYEEQIEIAEYLNKKCTEIDNLMNSKEKLIEELESYKKSLIYEYVTGKKEVI